MATLRRLEKPLWTKEKGVILDGAYISESLRKTLQLLLPKRWDMTSKAVFMDSLDEWVQLVSQSRSTNSPAQQKKALHDVECAAHALLVTLRKLDLDAKQNLDTRTAYLAQIYGGRPPVTLSNKTALLWDGDSALRGWWDVVQDMELAAGHAGANIKPGKGQRVTQDHARALIQAAANAVYETVGKIPSGSKGTWFAAFAGALCEGLGVKQSGVALIEAVLKKMK